MEKAVISLDVQTGSGLKSLRMMKQEMKELQIAMSRASDPTEFKRLEAEFAILRNDMKDTSMAMKYLDPGELLGGWVKMTQGLVGSFAAVTGAIGLFGGENEKLQEIERKSMLLIQTMIGLEQARMLLIDGGGKAERKTLISSTVAWLGKTLGIKQNTAATAANTTATKVQATATGVQTIATGGATIATKLLGAAMKALPIFAIIGAVVGLVSALGSLMSASKEAAEAQKKLEDAESQYRQTHDALKDSVKDYVDSVKKGEIEHKLAMGEMTQDEYNHAKNTQEMLDSLDEVRLKYAADQVASQGIINQEKVIAEKELSDRLQNIAIMDYKTEADRQNARNLAYREHNERLEQIQTNHFARMLWSKKEYDKAFDSAEEEKNRKQEEDDKAIADKKAADAKRAAEEWARNKQQANEFLYKIDVESLTEREKIWENYNKNTWSKAAELLGKGLINQAEYDRVMLESKEKYYEDLDKLDVKVADEQEEAVKKHQETMLDLEIASLENRVNSAKTSAEVLAAEIEVINAKSIKSRLVADLEYDDAVKAADEKLKYDLSQVMEGDIESEKKAKEAHYIALQNAADEHGVNMKNIINSTNNEIEVKNKEHNEQIKEDAKNLTNIIADLRIETADNELEARDAELASLDLQMKDELEAVKDNEEAKLLIEEKYAKLREETQLNYINNMISKYGDYINNISSNISTTLSNLTEMAMMEIDMVEKEYNDKYTAQSTALDNSLEKAKDVWGEESKQYKALVAQKIKLDQDKADQDKAIEKQKKDAQNKYAKFQIGLQIAEATVAYGKGMIEAVAATIKNPVWGVIMIATLSAMYGKQLALMTKQMGMVGKMRRGGFITGPNHESGGITKELEGGEAVLNANSMRIPGVRNLASRLNEMGGGVSFGSSSSGADLIDYEKLASLINDKQVYVSLNDINRGQKKLKVIENKTSF